MNAWWLEIWDYLRLKEKLEVVEMDYQPVVL